MHALTGSPERIPQFLAWVDSLTPRDWASVTAEDDAPEHEEAREAARRVFAAMPSADQDAIVAAARHITDLFARTPPAGCNIAADRQAYQCLQSVLTMLVALCSRPGTLSRDDSEQLCRPFEHLAPPGIFVSAPARG